MATIAFSGASSERAREVHVRAAYEFGRLVARRGWTLRTGGGWKRSLMGAAADGALAEGGRVEGVILKKFWPIRHRRLRALRAVTTFDRRKAALFRGADAAVFFPGGYGTLDEFGDLLALKQNDFFAAPILMVNVAGYFDPLLAWCRKADREGFLYGRPLFEVARTPRAAVRRLCVLLGTEPQIRTSARRR